LAEKGKKGNSKEHSLTSWLKLKFLGKGDETGPVDTQFLTDLSDIKTIGRYEILKKIGHGSMGVVYLGRDPYIKRNVGIKISRPAADVGEEKAEKYREKFFIEAQSAGRLMHPNIVAIYDAGMHKDFCYMAMEYIDGPTLKKFCKKNHLLPISNVLEIIFITCKALDHAHKMGVVHRDIKPLNIMLKKSGHIKITDFGIAQIKSEQTASKGIIGSPSYMSPEQIRQKPVENQTDIFSLGCVLYELLTGKMAFPGDDYVTIMYKIIKEDPTPMEQIRPELPEILLKITKKALAKDPNQRYQTCEDFAYDLRVALRGLKESTKSTKAEDVFDYVNSVSFFESFNREQVKEILKSSSVYKVPRGDAMVAEGDIEDSFFILLSGKALVQKNNKNIAFISRGECFGEMAYLSGQARAATVLAETDCILMEISATLLDRSSESIQLLFLKSFAKNLIQRLSMSNIEK
jgi:serine/threonine-protein kinase